MSVYSNLISREKYEHAGIYSISSLGQILYIGQSKNMRKRIMDHINQILDPAKSNIGERNKYVVLNQIYFGEFGIDFDVVEYQEEESLDKMESRYINQYKPILNMQIPMYSDNTFKLYKNMRARTITLDDILSGETQYHEEDLIDPLLKV